MVKRNSYFTAFSAIHLPFWGTFLFFFISKDEDVRKAEMAERCVYSCSETMP